MIYIWLGVIIALIMIEFISKNLTAACFCISAIFSLISVNTKTNNYIVQVAIFLIGGIVLMVFARPNVLNIIEELKKKRKKTKKQEEKEEPLKEEVKEEIKEEKKDNIKKTVSSSKTKSSKTNKKGTNSKTKKKSANK